MATTAASDITYYTGQGNVLIAPRLTAGAINGGYIDVGDTTGFSISMKQTMVKIQENQTGMGFTAASYPVAVEASVKMTLANWSASNLALAMQAVAPTPNPGGTVTSESVIAYNGSSFFLANIGVQNSTLVLKTTGSTPVTLVAGTDYTVNGSFGQVTILPGSTNVPPGAGVPLTASYTYSPNNGTVGMSTQGIIERSVRINAKNVANPFQDANNSSFAAVSFTLHRVQFELSKMFDLIGKKDATLELDGEILLDPTIPYIPGNPMSPFFQITKA